MSDTTGFTIGVDIGGTFTDAIVVDGDGKVSIGKAPSTPPAFATGFMNSLASAAGRTGIELSELLERAHGIYHGSTVGTNALVERRTAKVGLLTTSGMRDTMFLMRAGARIRGLPPEEMARVAAHTKPEPLVPKHLIEEVDERVTFDGRVLVELNEESCRRSIEQLAATGVEAFAVSFLWSVVNPAHEQRVAELIEEVVPGAFVSTSSQVMARPGEYERTVATVVNALIGPVMIRYLAALESDLTAAGYAGTLWIMSCTGGVIDSAYARSLPLLTIGSGPVGGLIGAGALARASGADGGTNGSGAVDVITTDMGGTTFDVGVIRRGRPLARASTWYEQYEYFQPTLDVRSVGSGGGSIVRFDEASRSLRVGPRSAGANPGPAAYLRGGTEATVTDADLVLGYLNPDFFLGGELTLSVEAALEALARAGAPLGLSGEETAAATARIVDNQMADAIRLASVQQGYDPRTYTMYAYGGAGPVHGGAVARALGMTRIVVPLGDLAAGWSAFGIASADAVVVEESPQALRSPFEAGPLNAAWDDLEARATAAMERQGVPPSAIQLDRILDMRYTAQVNQVAVAAPAGVYENGVGGELVSMFEHEYERLFGQGSGYPAAGYAITGMRVRAHAPRGDFRLTARGELRRDGDARKATRDVLFYERGTQRVATPVYEGAGLSVDGVISGPAIIEFADTTVVVRHGQKAALDELGSLVLSL